MSRVVVLSVRRYGFQNDEGELVEGCTVTFLDPSAAPDPTGTSLGLPVMNINGSLAIFDEFERRTGVEPLASLPGVFDLDMAMRPGKRNRPTLSLVGVQFVAAVNFEKISKNTQPKV